MLDGLVGLPINVRRRLAKALETGILVPPYPDGMLRSVLGIQKDDTSVFAAVRELERLGISGPAAAEWITALDDVSSKTPKPDLVWSGPEIPGLHARDTRRVYEELIGSAQQSIWASTFVFFDGPKAFGHLAERMDTVPELQVKLFLNIQRKWSDSTAAEHLVRKFTDGFWKDEWPGTRRPDVFYDPRSLEIGKPGGVLHAKAIVADNEAVFITSANLTEAALDRNIEVGILLRDRTMAINLSNHFQGLIDKGLLSRLPNE